MNHATLYRDVLKNAWLITWRHKFLWIFGFFIAIILGNGGEVEILFNNYQTIMDSQDTVSSIKNLYQTGFVNIIISNIQYLFSHQPLAGIFIVIIFVALLIALIWLAVTSQAALFSSVSKFSNKENVNFAGAYKTGRKFFAPVFAVNILGRLAIWILFIVVGLPLLTLYLLKGNLLGAFLFTILAVVVLLPLMLIISFIIKYAIAYLVIKNYHAWDAIRAGWKLFIKNWLVSVEMTVIIFLVSILAGFVFILVAAVVAIPFVLWAILALFLATASGFTAAISIGIVPVVLTFTILGAIFSTFQQTAWVLLFQRLAEEKAVSKIFRLVESVGQILPAKK